MAIKRVRADVFVIDSAVYVMLESGIKNSDLPNVHGEIYFVPKKLYDSIEEATNRESIKESILDKNFFEEKFDKYVDAFALILNENKTLVGNALMLFAAIILEEKD